MSGAGAEKGGVWAGALAALSVLLFGLTGIIRLLAGDGAGMAADMLRLAPPEHTGLPAEEYPAVAEMLTGYLTDRIAEFQYFREAGEEKISAFHSYEAAHMADCRGLIRLDSAVCLASLATAAACLVWTGCAGRNRGCAVWRAFFRGAERSLLTLAALVLGLLLWAVLDFEGLFITFHRVAFRNDLWLLNPRTDLLIRLMPETLFIHLGIKGLGCAALWALAETAVIAVGGRRTRRNKHEISGIRGASDGAAAEQGTDPYSGAGNQLR